MEARTFAPQAALADVVVLTVPATDSTTGSTSSTTRGTDTQ